MSQLLCLSIEQLERINSSFLFRMALRVDDIKVISGIIYIIKHGLLQWKDTPREYGPYKIFIILLIEIK